MIWMIFIYIYDTDDIDDVDDIDDAYDIYDMDDIDDVAINFEDLRKDLICL